MCLFRARALFACLLLIASSVPVVCAQTPPGRAADGSALSLALAIERALAGNPALRGFGYSLRAQDARIAAAGQRPATEANFELENVLGSGEFGGGDAAEATFALSQVIELGARRRLRDAAARSEKDLLVVEQQAAQLDVLAEVSRRFVAVAAAQEQQIVLELATTLAQRTVDDVARRVRAGKSPEGELLRARAALSQAHLDQERAIAAVSAARQALAATWGAARPDFPAVDADLYRFPVLRDFEALAASVEANPDFLRFASAARLRDAQIRLARSQRKPDLVVSGGVRRFEDVGEQALVMGISVPLFSGRRAAPAIAEAEALRGLVDVEREAALVQARTQLYALFAQLRQSIRETEVLRLDVMPQLERALSATRYAYERGRYGYLELVDAQRALLDARAAAIVSAAAGKDLLAEIERLTSEPLIDERVLEQPK
jgi:outer membrane protein, heavy metal efflux system